MFRALSHEEVGIIDVESIADEKRFYVEDSFQAGPGFVAVDSLVGKGGITGTSGSCGDVERRLVAGDNVRYPNGATSHEMRFAKLNLGKSLQLRIVAIRHWVIERLRPIVVDFFQVALSCRLCRQANIPFLFGAVSDDVWFLER